MWRSGFCLRSAVFACTRQPAGPGPLRFHPKNNKNPVRVPVVLLGRWERPTALLRSVRVVAIALGHANLEAEVSLPAAQQWQHKRPANVGPAEQLVKRLRRTITPALRSCQLESPRGRDTGRTTVPLTAPIGQQNFFAPTSPSKIGTDRLFFCPNSPRFWGAARRRERAGREQEEEPGGRKMRRERACLPAPPIDAIDGALVVFRAHQATICAPTAVEPDLPMRALQLR